MKQRKFLVALCCVVAAVSAVESPIGAKLVLSQEGLNHIKDVALPYVEKLALSTTFGDIEGTVGTPVGDIEYSLHGLRLTTVDVAVSQVTLNPPKSIVVTASGIAGGASLAWGYREAAWPHVHDNGTAVLSTEKTAATLVFVLDVDGEGHLSLATAGCGLTLGDVHVKLSGGASWLYQVFVNVLVPLLRSTIEKTICAQLPPALDAMANSLLLTLPVMEPLPGVAGLGIDYALPQPAAVSELGLSVATRGEIFAMIEGPGHAPGQPVALPDGVVNAEVEVELSEWSLGSVAHASWRAGLLSKLLTQDDVPASAAQFFTTSTYAAYAPGLVEKYGKGTPVAVALAAKNAPVVLAAEKGFTVDAFLLLTILGKNTTTGLYDEAFQMLLDVDAEGVVSCDGDNVTGEIDVLDANTTLVESLVGPVDVDGFSDLVTFVLSMAEELANSFLATGFPIPAVDGITLVNPKVIWRPKYAVIAADLKFIPPTAAIKAMWQTYNN